MNQEEGQEPALPDELICIICMDLFLNPVVLTCGHSFCKRCISDHLNNKPVCPTCRSPTLYGGDILKPNFTLKSLIESKYNSRLIKRFTDSDLNGPDTTGVADLGQNQSFRHVACFPTQKRVSQMFVGSTKWVTLPGLLSNALLSVLCPSRLCFAGEPYTTSEHTRIASLLEIVGSEHEGQRSKLRVKALGRYRITESKRVDITESEEFAKKYLGNEKEKLFLDVFDAVEYRDEPFKVQNVQQFFTDNQYIRTKLAGFINQLAEHKHASYIQLSQSYSLGFLEDVNINWTPELVSSFTHQMCGMIHFSEKEHIENYMTTNPNQRFTNILNHLSAIDINHDAQVVLNLDDSHHEHHHIAIIIIGGFVLMLLLGKIFKFF